MSNMITKSIIVKADGNTAFKAWENFENFPQFMEYIESVTSTGNGTSHWVIKGPLGQKVEWDAFTTRVDMNKRIGWNTKDNKGDVTTSGQVTFNELPGEETEVTIMMQYEPKGGVLGDFVAKLFSNPEARVDEDLKNFKKYVEGVDNTFSTS